MSGFVLTCRELPPPGGACPAGQDEWVSIYEFIYSHLRDILFGAPLGADIRTVLGLTAAISVSLCLPLLLTRLIENVRSGGGI